MDESKIKALIKEVVQEELKDLVKTVNRIYEDREDIGAIKTRVGTLEDLAKILSEDLKKIRKDVVADIKDAHEDIREVREAIEGKEE